MLATMTASRSSLSRQLTFHFSFCYVVLYYTRFLLEYIPGVGTALNLASHLWDKWVYGMAGVQAPSKLTGSGDTFSAYAWQIAVICLAIVGSLVWTTLKRGEDDRKLLHEWLQTISRYALAFILFSYGVSKVFLSQFPPLTDYELTRSFGQSSPMGLLWNFMRFSPAYSIFGGLAEVIPALLLLFRRTMVLGALLSCAVLTNVVMLNFCYDVPVKLFSINLLLLSAFLLIPDAHRLYRFFILNTSTQPQERMSPVLRRRFNTRWGLTAKCLGLSILLGWVAISTFNMSRGLRSNDPTPTPLTTRGFHWIQEAPYNR